MTAPRSPASPKDTTRTTGLNPAHVCAAALAAVTAAVVGSTLGAAGTLIGAAGASVITTVSTAVYEFSLQRSRERVRSFSHRTPSSPRSRQESRIDRSRPAVVNTPLSDEQFTDSIDRRAQSSDHSRWFATLRWGVVVAGALGAFLVALVFITGFEWASGETVGGHGKGTTIGQVISPRLPPAPPSPPSSSAPLPQTPTQTPTSPATSTTTPDDGAGVGPSAPKTSDRPVPSKPTPTPPLIPPVLPGVGG